MDNKNNSLMSYMQELMKQNDEFNRVFNDIAKTPNGIKFSRKDFVLSHKIKQYKESVSNLKPQNSVYSPSDMFYLASILSDLLPALKSVRASLRKRQVNFDLCIKSIYNFYVLFLSRPTLVFIEKKLRLYEKEDDKTSTKELAVFLFIGIVLYIIVNRNVNVLFFHFCFKFQIFLHGFQYFSNRLKRHSCFEWI